LIDCDEQGYVIAGEDGATTAPGVFVAGDSRKKRLRQIVTAVADGANAVTSVQDFMVGKSKN
jgi:thioredoxin reductase (NADPH)